MNSNTELVRTHAQTTANAGPAMCDTEGCDQPAVYTYVFDWASTGSGGTGHCCARHSVNKQQQARNTKRNVTFTAIAGAPPAPMARDERTRLTAANLVLQEELNEVRQRSQEVYQRNTNLTAEVQRLTVLNRDLTARTKDAEQDAATAIEESAVAQQRSAELADEVNRLRTLLGSEGG